MMIVTIHRHRHHQHSIYIVIIKPISIHKKYRKMSIFRDRKKIEKQNKKLSLPLFTDRWTSNAIIIVFKSNTKKNSLSKIEWQKYMMMMMTTKWHRLWWWCYFVLFLFSFISLMKSGFTRFLWKKFFLERERNDLQKKN